MQTTLLDHLFQGLSLWLRPMESGFVELCFDRQDGFTNKLDQRTLAELHSALAALRCATTRTCAASW